MALERNYARIIWLERNRSMDGMEDISSLLYIIQSWHQLHR